MDSAALSVFIDSLTQSNSTHEPLVIVHQLHQLEESRQDALHNIACLEEWDQVQEEERIFLQARRKTLAHSEQERRFGALEIGWRRWAVEQQLKLNDLQAAREALKVLDEGEPPLRTKQQSARLAVLHRHEERLIAAAEGGADTVDATLDAEDVEILRQLTLSYVEQLGGQFAALHSFKEALDAAENDLPSVVSQGSESLLTPSPTSPALDSIPSPQPPPPARSSQAQLASSSPSQGRKRPRDDKSATLGDSTRREEDADAMEVDGAVAMAEGGNGDGRSFEPEESGRAPEFGRGSSLASLPAGAATSTSRAEPPKPKNRLNVVQRAEEDDADFSATQPTQQPMEPTFMSKIALEAKRKEAERLAQKQREAQEKRRVEQRKDTKPRMAESTVVQASSPPRAAPTSRRPVVPVPSAILMPPPPPTVAAPKTAAVPFAPAPSLTFVPNDSQNSTTSSSGSGSTNGSQGLPTAAQPPPAVKSGTSLHSPSSSAPRHDSKVLVENTQSSTEGDGSREEPQEVLEELPLTQVALTQAPGPTDDSQEKESQGSSYNSSLEYKTVSSEEEEQSRAVAAPPAMARAMSFSEVQAGATSSPEVDDDVGQVLSDEEEMAH